MMKSDLANKRCLPCKAGGTPLRGEELASFARQLGEGWEVVDGHHLKKTFRFSASKRAFDFVGLIGKIVEREGHHPDLFLSWRSLEVRIWTHKIDGLSEADFVLAAKIDAESISREG